MVLCVYSVLGSLMSHGLRFWEEVVEHFWSIHSMLPFSLLSSCLPPSLVSVLQFDFGFDHVSFASNSFLAFYPHLPYFFTSIPSIIIILPRFPTELLTDCERPTCLWEKQLFANRTHLLLLHKVLLLLLQTFFSEQRGTFVWSDSSIPFRKKTLLSFWESSRDPQITGRTFMVTTKSLLNW